jgi:pyruvate dehydrogenase E1 component
MYNQNEGRTGVLIRCVTRGVEQKEMLQHLRKQKRFKADQSVALHPKGFPISGAQDESQVGALPDETILNQIKLEVLKGAYYLVDYRGYHNYSPGDNVVHIFSMGSVTTEALKASQNLLSKGIYANIIVVTSPDLLVGNLAHQTGYQYLIEELGINATLYAQNISQSELPTLAGLRIPIVSVHDGEPGLLDNLGSIVGVKQICLAVRKHSKCGRPNEIYHFHEIDFEAVEKACMAALDHTARELITLR